MNVYCDILYSIAKLYNEKVITCIDSDGLICVYIKNIDCIYKRKYLRNLEGRGCSFDVACENYINNAMDTNYNLRYKIKFYATTKIRRIIRKYEVKVNV